MVVVVTAAVRMTRLTVWTDGMLIATGIILRYEKRR